MDKGCTDICRRDVNDGKCISHKARELAFMVLQACEPSYALELADEIIEITEDF